MKVFTVQSIALDSHLIKYHKKSTLCAKETVSETINGAQSYYFVGETWLLQTARQNNTDSPCERPIVTDDLVLNLELNLECIYLFLNIHPK